MTMNVTYLKANIKLYKYPIIPIISEKIKCCNLCRYVAWPLNQTTPNINHLFIKIVSKIKSLRNFSNAAPTSLQP